MNPARKVLFTVLVAFAALLVVIALIIGVTLASGQKIPGLNFYFSHKGEIMQSQLARIRLGDPNRSDLGPGASIDRHAFGKDVNIGINFYEQGWSSKAPGTVEFVHGRYSFIMYDVYHVMGSDDSMHPEEGITDWTINAGLTPAETLDHQVARDRMMALLAQVQAAGWQRYIETDAPRLSGKQAWHYASSGGSIGDMYSLDPAYIPTMDEWRDVIGRHLEPRWIFQADGAYIFIVLMGSGTSEAKGHYRLEIEIDDEYDFYAVRYINDENKRMKWKELLPALIEDDYRSRDEEEAKLRAQGYTINTVYHNQPIKALQPSSGVAGH